MNVAETLLSQFRIAGIVVTVDGAEIRCRAAKGRLTPDLVHELKACKPQMLALLRAEDREVAWRTASLGADLLADPVDVTHGVCSYCGSSMPYGQSGKCVLCCLAAAEMVLARLAVSCSTGQATYREEPVTSTKAPESQERTGFRDMSPIGAGRNAA